VKFKCCGNDFDSIDKPSLESVALQDPEQNKIDRLQNLRFRIDQYKPAWAKNGVIQYKI